MLRKIARLLFSPLIMVPIFVVLGTGAGFAEQERLPAPSHKKLVVAVINDPPMVMKDNKGRWTGFSVELWRAVAQDLGLEYEFKDLHFKEIEDNLRQGKIDVSVAPLYETVDRHRSLDFSTAIGSTQFAVAVLREKEVHPFIAGLKVFLSWEIFKIASSFFAILTLAGLIFWLIERRQNPQHFGGNPLKGIGTGIYWVGSTLVSGICTGVPLKTTLGRIVGLLWILAGAIAFGALTASLVSSLIGQQQLQSDRYEVSTLRGMRLGAINGTTQAMILEKMGGNFSLFEKTDDGLKALLEKRIDGFFSHERLMNFEEKIYKNKFSVHLTTLKKRRFGFAFPKDSPLREGVNVSLIGFMESPKWESLAARYGMTSSLEPIAKKKGGGF